jgi:catechol 2,3-dioxygenase-like lactoylglutathione lyase family enzyme
MPDERVEFRRFHHVTLAVPDLGAATTDWTDRLGWTPSMVTETSAIFPLDDSYIELVAAGDGDPGIVSVSVVVDDVDEATNRWAERGASFRVNPEGHATIDPIEVNGVPMELRPEAVGRDGTDPATVGVGRPYRRFNHIIVAVADDDAAVASWTGLFGEWAERPSDGGEAVRHVPVGIAWFGLTGSGTDAPALARFLARRGEGVYGLALVVDDHPVTISALEGRGAHIVRQSSSGQTFVHPKTSHGILIDLVPERHPSRLD